MEPIEVSDTIEETLCRQATAQRIPINGILELTPLCNMDCRMCYVRLSRQEMEARGRLRTAEEWLALGRQMQQAGTLFLLLTGGEPLMYPQFKEVYLGLKKLGMVLTVNTNGTLIDEEWAAFFGAHKPRRVNITLYGADDEAYEKLCRRPGGFSETIQAIRLLRSKGVDVKLNGSITPINQNDAERIIQIARSLDIPYKLDTYMYPATRERGRAYDETARLTPEAAAAVRVRLMRAGSTEAQFRDMAHKALSAVLKDGDRPVEGIGCRAGRSSFMLNWQGQMRPCVMVNDPTAPVFELGFGPAWNYIVEQTAKIRLSPRCAGCGMRTVCQTCAACALLETGSYDGTPDYMCRYTRESLRLLQESLSL